MRRLRPYISFLLAVVIFVSAFPINGFAAVTTGVWNGRTPLEAGKSYYISSTVTVRNNFTIPEGTKLTVTSRGKLLIIKNVNVYINGTLNVIFGGSVISSAEMTVNKNGKLDINGEFKSSVSAVLTVKGTVSLRNNSAFQSSSTINIYKTGTVDIYGETSFTNSSKITNSGAITVHPSGNLKMYGIFNISLSGSLYNTGYISVGKNASVKNSGTITLEEDCGYNRFGSVTNTKSGDFIDNRIVYLYADLTVETLVDEPEVISHGIDVSYANGTINWNKVANDGIEFAMIRAARSKVSASKPLAADTRFVDNITGATAAGLDVGVYFYSYAMTAEQSKEDAEFLVDLLTDYKLTYPVVLDIEEGYYNSMGVEELTEIVEAFFEVVSEAGYFPMLYSYKSWLINNLDMTILDKYAVWLAEVKSAPTYEGGFYIWQYSFTGKVDGISGGVDLDISYRDFPRIFKEHGLNNL